MSTGNIWCLGWWTWTQGISFYQVPCHSKRNVKQPSIHFLFLFLLPFFPPLYFYTSFFFFSLLPLSSLESKVKPSSVELENSESLFLKQVTATRHLTCPPLFFFFSSSFFLSVYILCLCLPLSVPILPLRLSSPPFLSPLPVPEGGEKEASQSHQCDLI